MSASRGNPSAGHANLEVTVARAQGTKTHCPAGHPYSGENLYVDPTGRRHCRECRRAHTRVHRARQPPRPAKRKGVAATPWQERFWRFVTSGALDECWEWQGARNRYGYGRLNRGGHSGRTLKAHRASYEIHFGVDPGALDVCHRCDNPPCVNPAHLFVGDARANARDMAAKGRAGPQNGGSASSRFPDAQVRKLRHLAASGVPYETLATQFEVSVRYAAMLANGSRGDAGGPITRKRGGLRFSDEQIRDLRQRVAGGASIRHLGATLGIHETYLSSIVSGRIRRAAGGPLTRYGRPR